MTTAKNPTQASCRCIDPSQHGHRGPAHPDGACSFWQQVATNVMAGLDAIPTYVYREEAPPLVFDRDGFLKDEDRAQKELAAEVERAGEAAAAASAKLAERHHNEWSALTARVLVGVTAPRERARILRILADAMELSAQQGCELVRSAHDVLDGELAKLAPSPARPPSRSTVSVDALVSGDPRIVMRALWSGDAAADGEHALRAISEWVHGQVGDSELEGRFETLLAELLLSLGSPRLAAA